MEVFEKYLKDKNLDGNEKLVMSLLQLTQINYFVGTNFHITEKLIAQNLGLHLMTVKCALRKLANKHYFTYSFPESYKKQEVNNNFIVFPSTVPFAIEEML